MVVAWRLMSGCSTGVGDGDDEFWRWTYGGVKMDRTLLLSMLLNGPFVLVKENRTFEEALIHCRHNYHDLAWSIDKEPWKSEALKEIQKAKSEFVWVGLHFACFFEEWFWVDGKYVSATNDNWKNSVEGKCGDVAAVKKKDNKWYKENLGKKYNFICHLCWSVSLDLEYHFIDKNMSWFEAQHYCKDHFTDLASVNDMKDLKNLKAAANGRTDAWIGLHTKRQTTDRKWHWSQPTVRYEKGDSPRGGGEPNDNGGAEKCVGMDENSKYLDDSCNKTYSCFICYNDGPFVLVKENKTFEEALIHCRHNYHNLAWSIDKEPWKSEALKEIQKAESEFVWVGLHLACFFEEWFWVDGKYVSATNNNWKNSVEGKCGDVAAVKKKDNKWYKKNLGKKYNFICMRSCPCNG
uniref:C-type lectin domain-containing protein n=1 Tax=Knipowitschia caucasica TaxID=637954 RepID=A0AAV2KSP3_KNICA